jgi:hypothetical protein
MHEAPRQQLRELIATYGRPLAEDPRRCEGFLRDFCAPYRLEVAVLVSALEEGVAAELLIASEDLPTEVLLARLARRLQDHLGLAAGAARWAVGSWALALGKLSSEELGKLDEAIYGGTMAAQPSVTSPQPVLPVTQPAASTPTLPMMRRRRKWPAVVGVLLTLALIAGVSVGLFLNQVPERAAEEELRQSQAEAKRQAEKARREAEAQSRQEQEARRRAEEERRRAGLEAERLARQQVEAERRQAEMESAHTQVESATNRAVYVFRGIKLIPSLLTALDVAKNTGNTAMKEKIQGRYEEHVKDLNSKMREYADSIRQLHGYHDNAIEKAMQKYKSYLVNNGDSDRLMLLNKVVLRHLKKFSQDRKVDIDKWKSDFEEL